MPATSRRRSVRFDVPPGLTVKLAEPGQKARILDIGLGGVGLACSAPLRRGAVHTLTF